MSKIEWTEKTWTPLGVDELNEHILLQPLRWRKPRRIAVEQVHDLFDGTYFTDEMRDRIFAVMALCPQHTFQVLTKRPERMLEYLSNEDLAGELLDEITDMADWNHSPRNMVDAVERACKRTGVKECLGEHPMTGKDVVLWIPEINIWPLPNVWLGTSVEDQKTADARIPLLLQTPAAVRFVSAEPLLGAVDLTNINAMVWFSRYMALINPHEAMRQANSDFYPKHCSMDALTGYCVAVEPELQERIDWVICGGESGPGARPMHPGWARSLRDQCVAAGVPFFFKQGSNTPEWGKFKDRSSFPADLQIREYPQDAPVGFSERSNA